MCIGLTNQALIVILYLKSLKNIFYMLPMKTQINLKYSNVGLQDKTARGR